MVSRNRATLGEGSGTVATALYHSPVGTLLLAEREAALVGLWMEGQRHFLGALQGARLERRDTPTLRLAERWLDRYFAGERPTLDALPLAPIGSAFRQAVWKVLREIPYGETITYGEIARALAARGGTGRVSAQAVGGAVGHNPIAIIIPCHRVVGAGGRLVGYAGGLWRKAWLLAHEVERREL